MVYAIILSAGKGLRMGRETPKQYLYLGDRPILSHTIHAFDRSPSIDKIVVVSSISDQPRIRDEIFGAFPPSKPVLFVEGGDERQGSVYNALHGPLKDAEVVAIHDGVRPLIQPEVIEQTIIAARAFGAAAAGMPAKETVKEVNAEGFAIHTPDRSRLWMVQTPQTFQYALILRAHQQAQMAGYTSATDDSVLVERLGHPVRMVAGTYENIKITTPEDILTAELILKERNQYACRDRI